MDIALYHTTLPLPGQKPGGVAVAVDRLAQALAESGRDRVTVYSLTTSPGDRAYEHVQLFGSARWLGASKLPRLFLLPWLLNFIDFGRHEVLHLHGDDWFFLRRRTATVRTLHGSALFEARSATSWRRGVVQRIVYPLEHLARRLATICLAVGPATQAVYSADDLADNGIDPKRFYPGQKTTHPQVLFVGTWEGRKRGRFVYDAFLKTVLPACPAARLVMVSDRCNTHPNVTSIQAPNDSELAQLYRESWVFAYPSVYEGFGIPYVEALGSGTAVVCSPNDGADYVLESGKYGSVVDDSRFGEEVLRLLQDSTYRSEREDLGRSRAASFHWESVAQAHRAQYTRAIDLYRADDQSNTEKAS